MLTGKMGTGKPFPSSMDWGGSLQSAFRLMISLSRFYYADEREPNGKPVGLSLDGSAHADMYYSLAHEPKQSKWQVTFVKGEGRRDFAGYDWEGETRADYDRKFGRT